MCGLRLNEPCQNPQEHYHYSSLGPTIVWLEGDSLLARGNVWFIPTHWTDEQNFSRQIAENNNKNTVKRNDAFWELHADALRVGCTASLFMRKGDVLQGYFNSYSDAYFCQCWGVGLLGMFAADLSGQ